MLENRPYLRYLLKALSFLGAFGCFTMAALFFFQNRLIYLPDV
jgi:hypothetical protein